jgi:hypothetical protein
VLQCRNKPPRRHLPSQIGDLSAELHLSIQAPLSLHFKAAVPGQEAVNRQTKKFSKLWLVMFLGPLITSPIRCWAGTQGSGARSSCRSCVSRRADNYQVRIRIPVNKLQGSLQTPGVVNRLSYAIRSWDDPRHKLPIIL